MLWSTIRNLWQDLIDGFWFIPGLVFLSGPCLAWLFLTIDYAAIYPESLYQTLNSPSAVRSLLTAMSGALISITALIFSITLVTLQLVSSQFTPRALRGLLSSRRTQGMVGGLVGIFAYCQMVTVAVRDETATTTGFVPLISTFIAIGLAFGGLALLIFFISHTVHSIQIANIAARITHETIVSLNHPYPPILPGCDKTNDGDETVKTWHASEKPYLLYAQRQGYVQSIAISSLYKQIKKQGLRLNLRIYPGLFVTRQHVAAEIWFPASLSQSQRERYIRYIQSCISLHNERDIAQDPAFGVRQLADIALRALSAAINDPTTAVLCIDYLGSLMEKLIQEKHGHHPYCYANTLVVTSRTLPEYSEVLLEIGRCAGSNARVVVNLLQVLENVAQVAGHIESQDRHFLSIITESAARAGLGQATLDIDRTLIERQYRRTQKKIEALLSAESSHVDEQDADNL